MTESRGSLTENWHGSESDEGLANVEDLDLLPNVDAGAAGLAHERILPLQLGVDPTHEASVDPDLDRMEEDEAQELRRANVPPYRRREHVTL